MFKKNFNINSVCYNICLYYANNKDLNNAKDKIFSFKLYNITRY